MTDIPTVALVSRTQLSMGNLDVNDHVNYVLAGPQAVNGAVQWERKQISAPWVDGDITVSRRRVNSTESISFYVAGSTMSALDTNLGTIIEAFQQDRFTFQMIVQSANHAWDCEAADISSVLYDTAHVANKYVTITFAVPRQPIPLAGAF